MLFGLATPQQENVFQTADVCLQHLLEQLFRCPAPLLLIVVEVFEAGREFGRRSVGVLLLALARTEAARRHKGLDRFPAGKLLLHSLLFGHFFDVEEGLDELLAHRLLPDILLEAKPTHC